jgi:hypothetical protein
MADPYSFALAFARVFAAGFFVVSFAGARLRVAFAGAASTGFAFSAFGFLGLAGAGAFATPDRASADMVISRAMSRLTCRTRAVFSSWPVARWKRRLNCSFFSRATSSLR